MVRAYSHVAGLVDDQQHGLWDHRPRRDDRGVDLDGSRTRRAPRGRLAAMRRRPASQTAVALVSALTLVRAGSLPQFEQLFDYARLYAVGGLRAHADSRRRRGASADLPDVRRRHRGGDGTGAAQGSGEPAPDRDARVVRGVRARRRRPTMPAPGIQPPWSISSARGRSRSPCYVVVVAELLDGARAARTRLPPCLVLFGFGLAACSLAQVPSRGRSWSASARPLCHRRLAVPGPARDVDGPAGARFRRVARRRAETLRSAPGVPVAILLTHGAPRRRRVRDPSTSRRTPAWSRGPRSASNGCSTCCGGRAATR